MDWSIYQEAIFAAVTAIHALGYDLVVLARAGTGKTSTMIQAVIRYVTANPGRSVLTCAFNVKNAKELQSKLDTAGLDWKTAVAKTLNAVGLATVKKCWGKGIQVEPKKGRDCARAACDALPKLAAKVDSPDGKVQKLATLAKITLTSPKKLGALADLCRSYGVASDDAEVEALAILAGRAMELSAEDRTQVDFDDQLWFPHIYEMVPWQYDLVVVDEAQDMNPSQLALARASVKRGGRLVAVGDDRQAIYGWRAADSGFLDRMVRELGAKTLPLPRTYRCGTAIVDEARKLVPDYEAAESNPTGIVRTAAESQMMAGVKRGDFILCRANAPLLPLCLELLRNRIPAAIQGRDILGQILGMVTKSKCETTEELAAWLGEHERRERVKLDAADADEALIEALHDRCACLRALLPEADTIDGLRLRLEELFSDTDDANRVTLSTAHRAKGLERDRVWLLRGSFRSGGQEDNCLYVAITRARHELIYVQ